MWREGPCKIWGNHKHEGTDGNLRCCVCILTVRLRVEETCCLRLRSEVRSVGIWMIYVELEGSGQGKWSVWAMGWRCGDNARSNNKDICRAPHLNSGSGEREKKVINVFGYKRKTHRWVKTASCPIFFRVEFRISVIPTDCWYLVEQLRSQPLTDTPVQVGSCINWLPRKMMPESISPCGGPVWGLNSWLFSRQTGQMSGICARLSILHFHLLSSQAS